MSGPDISRWSHDSLNDYALALMQQGRVLLDDDVNVSAAILERRSRASDYDLAGLAPLEGIRGIAAVPKTTPRAFAIEPGAVIMPGRIYVDGLIAENHGSGDVMFDPALEEPNYADGVPESDQPYLPAAAVWPKRPAWPAQGRHLVYLVVAKREVDRVLDPKRIDPAFDLETSVMMQSVWQVRTLEVGAGVATPTQATHDADIPGWKEHIEPSSGRLSTRMLVPDPGDKPCELPPLGGYRGLENQNYRVQVVKAGPIGVAEFVWSRENGSVRTSVLDVIDSRNVRVADAGRDDVLSFGVGDLVQLVDEVDQLSNIDDRASGGGVLTRVAAVRHDEGMITFADDAAASFAGIDHRARRLRLVRWDNGTKVLDVTGADVTSTLAPAALATLVSTTETLLEAGIAVKFSESPGSSGFAVGDYFTFAARYRNSSIEELSAAAPRGIHRHYARLGVLDGGTFTDHRRLVPPDSAGPTQPADESCDCCDVVVTEKSHSTGKLTIANAIDQVHGKGGGIVRICPGIFHLEKGLRLDGLSAVTVRGSGPATVIVCGEDLVVLEACSAMTFEHFTAVVGNSCSGVVVGGASAAIGLRWLTIVGLAAEGLVAEQRKAAGRAPIDPLVAINGVVEQLEIDRCTLAGAIGVGVWSGSVDGPARATHLVRGIRFSDGSLLCSQAGIEFGPSVFLADRVYIDGALIALSRRVGVAVTGSTIDGCEVRVARNRVSVLGDGVVVGAERVTVSDNLVVRPFDKRRSEFPTRSVAAAVHIMQGGDTGSPTLAQSARIATPRGAVVVCGNRIRGFAFAILSVAAVHTLSVTGNAVDACGFGVFVHARAGRVSVSGNSVLALYPLASRSVCAIAVWAASAVHVADNRIDGARPHATGNDVDEVLEGVVPPGVIEGIEWSRGISIAASREVSVTGNTLRHVASIGTNVESTGIEVFGPFRTVTISDNTVFPAAAGQRLGGIFLGKEIWRALHIDRGATVARVLGRVDQEPKTFTRGVLAMSSREAEDLVRDGGQGFRTVVASAAGADLIEERPHRATVGVHDNDLGGFSPRLENGTPTVEIQLARGNREMPNPVDAGALRFGGNSVDGASPRTVVIHADVASISANAVLDGRLDVEVEPSCLTLVGNVVAELSPSGTLWDAMNTVLP